MRIDSDVNSDQIDCNLQSYLIGDGLPNSRTEHWRMTPVNRLYNLNYKFTSIPFAVSEKELNNIIKDYIQRWKVSPNHLIVMLDGRLLNHLSDFNCIRVHQGFLFSTDYNRLPFVGQNHAISNLAYRIDLQHSLGDSALHLLCLSTTTELQASFNKVFIILSSKIQATIVESHLSLNNNINNQKDLGCYVNQNIQIQIQAGAHLNHYKYQSLSLRTLHIAATQVQVAEDSHYDGFVMHLGGQFVRHDQEIEIIGSKAHVVINGAYIGAEMQHIDNTSQIKHLAPDSYSREVFKGVITDKARGVFQARIYVHQNAQLTDAYQMNRALILSPLAEINAKPELEIYADDVKCSHGATVGALDVDQIFYLTSRGINRDIAIKMLIEAYLEEIFFDIKHIESAIILADLAREKLHDIALRLVTN